LQIGFYIGVGQGVRKSSSGRFLTLGQEEGRTNSTQSERIFDYTQTEELGGCLKIVLEHFLKSDAIFKKKLWCDLVKKNIAVAINDRSKASLSH
jgi:hypothetical protein